MLIVLGWIALALVLVFISLCLALHFYVICNYLPHAIRIFEEKPLFIIPYGQPVECAEAVSFPTSNGLTLHGCYLPGFGQRKGVIMFGLEFGSTRWSCVPYCEFLRERGYDIFAFESRGQGESESQPGYEPLHWVTDFEVEDSRAALDYLKSRPDADPRGVGFFGISKGGGAGLFAAALNPYVRCCVTDGAFATHTTMVPYMQKWVLIYCHSALIVKALPFWYYGIAANMALTRIQKSRGCHFPHLEDIINRLSPRPWLAIHGGGDTYIKPEMARKLFEYAAEPKELWLVERAKHNQVLNTAGEEYKRRVLAFFDEHLAAKSKTVVPASTNGASVHVDEAACRVVREQEPAPEAQAASPAKFLLAAFLGVIGSAVTLALFLL